MRTLEIPGTSYTPDTFEPLEDEYRDLPPHIKDKWRERVHYLSDFASNRTISYSDTIHYIAVAVFLAENSYD